MGEQGDQHSTINHVSDSGVSRRNPVRPGVQIEMTVAKMIKAKNAENALKSDT